MRHFFLHVTSNQMYEWWNRWQISCCESTSSQLHQIHCANHLEKRRISTSDQAIHSNLQCKRKSRYNIRTANNGGLGNVISRKNGISQGIIRLECINIYWDENLSSRALSIFTCLCVCVFAAKITRRAIGSRCQSNATAQRYVELLSLSLSHICMIRVNVLNV